ncbi:rCG43447 [Rattus norvegicus]|uniref:RCG43447 n=1 Tax=Rattus norvegicus TaxID=10116 RepID=A6JID8_RAT|nr:rCG43447 [Rattus norvegicus]
MIFESGREQGVWKHTAFSEAFFYSFIVLLSLWKALCKSSWP